MGGVSLHDREIDVEQSREYEERDLFDHGQRVGDAALPATVVIHQIQHAATPGHLAITGHAPS